MVARVGIVTDSTVYLPSEIVERYSIKVVPLIVRFGDEDYAEGTEIDNQGFYRRFRLEKSLPKTSQPAVGDFLKAYQELLKEKEAVISIHISGGISGTVDAARAAAQMLDAGDGAGSKPQIKIIDSKIAAMALGFMAWEAGVMAEQGCDLNTIVARVEAIKRNIKAFFLVDNLEYLARGGRLSGMAAAVGSLLQIKPILHLVEGRIELLEKSRTKKRAVGRILELFLQDEAMAGKMRVAVIHADSLPEGTELKQMVEKNAPGAEVHISEFGPVLGTYLGPGALGLTYYDSKNDTLAVHS